jgi:O-antigen/teichoic acid export membrane protein
MSEDVSDGSAPTSIATDDALPGVERASIGRNVAALLSSQAVTWALATILSIVQPRFLGPSAQGQIRLAFSLWTIASVFIGMGTAVYLTLEVARHRRTGLALIGPIIVIRAIVFGICSVVMIAVVEVSGADAEFKRIMVLYGCSIFFATMSDTLTAAFIGLERMSVLAKANIAARIAGTIVAVLVLIAGGDASSVIAVGAAANLLALVILIVAMRPITSVVFRGWRSTSRLIVRASVGFLVAAAILTVYQQVDTVVMSVLVNRDALGWYSTGETLFGSLLFIPTIVMGSVFPVLGRLHKNDPASIPPLVRRTSSSLLFVTVPIGLGTAVVAGPIAPLLYGEAFRPTGAVLTVLGPVIILTAGNVLFGSLALATGRQSLWSSFMIAAIILTIPLDILFVPWADRTFSNGALGGALSYLVTESLLVVVGLSKVAPFLFERKFLWQAARIALAGAIMFAASWPLRNRMLLVPIAVAMVVYVVALILLRAPDDVDRRYAGRALARVGIRTPWYAAHS